jgi:predicted patatin/cPLA2 family phospholipase
MNNLGLVLEGGGMRGLFTAGVLDFFLEQDLFFYEVYGVSAGACNACNFISKQEYRSRDVWTEFLNNKDYFSFKNLMETGDIFKTDFAYDKIPNELNKFDYDAFNKSKTKMVSVATDVETGKPMYFKITNLRKQMDMIRASASLPIVSNKVLINNHLYLDGGMSDAIPIKKIMEDKLDKYVVILTRPINYRKKKNKSYLAVKKFYKDYPNLIKDTENRYLNYNNTLDYLIDEENKGNVFVIRPNRALKVKRLEKNKKKLIIAYNDGYNTAKELYPKLIKYLTK